MRSVEKKLTNNFFSAIERVQLSSGKYQILLVAWYHCLIPTVLSDTFETAKCLNKQHRSLINNHNRLIVSPLCLKTCFTKAVSGVSPQQKQEFCIYTHERGHGSATFGPKTLGITKNLLMVFEPAFASQIYLIYQFKRNRNLYFFSNVVAGQIHRVMMF